MLQYIKHPAVPMAFCGVLHSEKECCLMGLVLPWSSPRQCLLGCRFATISNQWVDLHEAQHCVQIIASKLSAL